MPERRKAAAWLRERLASLEDHVSNIIQPARPSPDCVPRIGNENGAIVTLPTLKPVAPLNPAEINPGLAPDMNTSPRGQ